MQTRRIEVWGQKEAEEEEDNEDEQVRIISGWDEKRWSMVRVRGPTIFLDNPYLGLLRLVKCKCDSQFVSTHFQGSLFLLFHPFILWYSDDSWMFSFSKCLVTGPLGISPICCLIWIVAFRVCQICLRVPFTIVSLRPNNQTTTLSQLSQIRSNPRSQTSATQSPRVAGSPLPSEVNQLRDALQVWHGQEQLFSLKPRSGFRGRFVCMCLFGGGSCFLVIRWFLY